MTRRGAEAQTSSTATASWLAPRALLWAFACVGWVDGGSYRVLGGTRPEFQVRLYPLCDLTALAAHARSLSPSLPLARLRVLSKQPLTTRLCVQGQYRQAPMNVECNGKPVYQKTVQGEEHVLFQPQDTKGWTIGARRCCWPSDKTTNCVLPIKTIS